MYDEYDEVNTIQTGDTTDLFEKSCVQHKNRRNWKRITDHDKYITIPEFNMLTKKNITENWKEGNLASQTEIADFVKETDFDKKL